MTFSSSDSNSEDNFDSDYKENSSESVSLDTSNQDKNDIDQ